MNKNFVLCWVLQKTNIMTLFSNGECVPVNWVQFTVVEDAPDEYLADNGFLNENFFIKERNSIEKLKMAFKVQMISLTDKEIMEFCPTGSQPNDKFEKMFQQKYFEQGKQRYLFNSAIN